MSELICDLLLLSRGISGLLTPGSQVLYHNSAGKRAAWECVFPRSPRVLNHHSAGKPAAHGAHRGRSPVLNRYSAGKHIHLRVHRDPHRVLNHHSEGKPSIY